DSPFGGLGCRRPILVTCGRALSQLWRPARRDARRRNVSRSAWRRRESGCSAGVKRGPPPRSRAAGGARRRKGTRPRFWFGTPQQPDLTLVETAAELRKRRIKTSRSSLWRFLDRHNITLKKSPASSRTAASRCGASAPPVDTRARYA